MTGFVEGEKITRISIGIFVLVGGMELFFGILSGSIALTADSIHTFTDALFLPLLFLV